jgi:hypothetical protein
MGKHSERFKQEPLEVISKKQADAQNDVLIKAHVLDAEKGEKFMEKSYGIIEKNLDYFMSGKENTDHILQAAKKENIPQEHRNAVLAAASVVIGLIKQSRESVAQVAKEFEAAYKPTPIMQH